MTLGRVLGAGLLVVLALTGCELPDAGAGPASSTSSTSTTPVGDGAPAVPEPARTAAAVLAALPVQAPAPMAGYSRTRFGPGWADVDGDGCDTRDEILERDAAGSEYGPDGCVDEVVIVDPYSGLSIDGRTHIDIDHVVALRDAWDTGAFGWSAGERERFANDPLNLLAVHDDQNRRKSDASTWLPPARDYRCPYVARRVAVKAGYGLGVIPAERDAAVVVLAGCPDEPLPTGEGDNG